MYETSPDDPASVVSKLCHKHSSEAVLLGEYSMDGNKVHVHVYQYMHMYIHVCVRHSEDIVLLHSSHKSLVTRL